MPALRSGSRASGYRPRPHLDRRRTTRALRCRRTLTYGTTTFSIVCPSMSTTKTPPPPPPVRLPPLSRATTATTHVLRRRAASSPIRHHRSGRPPYSTRNTTTQHQKRQVTSVLLGMRRRRLICPIQHLFVGTDLVDMHRRSYEDIQLISARRLWRSSTRTCPSTARHASQAPRPRAAQAGRDCGRHPAHGGSCASSSGTSSSARPGRPGCAWPTRSSSPWPACPTLAAASFPEKPRGRRARIPSRKRRLLPAVLRILLILRMARSPVLRRCGDGGRRWFGGIL